MLMLGYFAGFVARGDSIVLTLWLSHWVNDYVTLAGGTGVPTDPPPIRGCFCPRACARRLTAHTLLLAEGGRLVWHV